MIEQSFTAVATRSSVASLPNGEINHMKAIVEEDNIDVVVAIGDGSTVDTAKETLHITLVSMVMLLPPLQLPALPCTGLSVGTAMTVSLIFFLFLQGRCRWSTPRSSLTHLFLPGSRHGRRLGT